MIPDLNSTPPEDEVVGGVDIPGDAQADGEADADAGDVMDVAAQAVVVAAQVIHVQQSKNLNDCERFGAYLALKALNKGREVQKQNKEQVAELLNTCLRTVERIWKKASDQIAAGEEVDVSSKRKGNSGRRRMDLDLSRMSTIPLNRTSSMRALALQLDVPYTTLHRRFKWGKIRHHTNTLKPSLSSSNKINRLKFSISMLDEATLSHAMPSFTDISNIVHIDEKWFNMTKKKRQYYLLPDEPDPQRSVQNKNFIGKVMFLTALARPRFDEQDFLLFDGKIGVWPFVKEVAAARTLRNRDRGTIETKPVIVTRDVMREYICEKVIPAIQANWPEDDEEIIYIQQDNARTHILPNDPVFLPTIADTGLDIRLLQQLANSPDMNVMDLAFFSSIQSLTLENAPTIIRELIEDDFMINMMSTR